MDLHLDDAEAAELSRLVKEALSDLSLEISDTDNPEFRRTLRQRQEVLSALDQRITPP